MKRSVGAIVLAVLAGAAGVLAIIDVLRYLGLLPAVTFGGLTFFGFSFIGAILAAIVAVIWFWAAGKLWNQDEQGWLFMVVMAILYLILDFVALIAGTPLWSLFPSGLLSVLVLIIAFIPGTRTAFGRE